jgi:Uncharacterized bacitracin resistance protein
VGVFNILKMLLLSAAEALTEWLPVSNTGHLAVLGHYLGFDHWEANATLRDIFVAASLLGSVLAACALFLPNNGLFYKTPEGKKMIAGERLRFYVAILLAWIPCLLLALVFGQQFSDFIYDPESIRNLRMTMVLMILGGVISIFGEIHNRNVEPKYTRLEEIPVGFLFLLGLTQIVGFLPGACRFGLAILVAVAFGVERRAAVTLSVFMSLPSLFVCGALPILRNLNKIGGITASELLTAFVLAFLVSFFALRWIISMLSKRSLIRFGQYRVVFGILLYLFVIL